MRLSNPAPIAAAATTAIPAARDPRVPGVPPVRKALPGRGALSGRRVPPDPRANPALPEVLPVPRDLPDRKALWGRRVPWVPRDLWEPPDLPGPRAPQEQPDPPGHRDL